MKFKLLLRSAPGVIWISRRLTMVVGVTMSALAANAASDTLTTSREVPITSWKCRTGALPDTTYVIQRAVDFTPNDGVCTIAPSPPVGWLSLTTFTTSEAGAGAGHFVRMSTPDPRGFQFDVIFRVVRLNDDGTLDLSQVLMSHCMTVTAK